MGETPHGGPPAVPHVQDPPPGLTRARWLYVDEPLSHEVHAGIRQPPSGPEFVVREAAYGNVDPGETLDQALPLREWWEAQFHHLELETRLALLGRYWKYDFLRPGWRPLRAAPATEMLDMREVDVPLFPGDATFYHFKAPAAKRDAVVVRLSHFTPTGIRFLVAVAEFAFPDSERGALDLAHARLPVTPMRSVLAREHRRFASSGHRKLVRPEDFAAAYGRDWERDLLICYRDVLDRIAQGRVGQADAAQKAPLPDDPVYTDYRRALSDPRVAALHARFLTPEEEAGLMSGGEPFIRQAIARKRAKADRSEQHLLSILEASLLARDGLRHGAHQVDPEVAALVRRFAYYL
ncbi:MAG TPA: hypothetical protein VHH36_08210 [Candidatus Thermoplasmatota archaeon]|nr:hypothetical protein [Candidatus Thermoplasmatota archaeon]